jgi:flavin reductase (DIM6/NTAB) family NADH-FMN oxidoreductase RutF
MSAFDEIAATSTSRMTIVTTRAGDEMDGCLVGFSTQCSIDPVRQLVCLSVKNRTYELARLATHLVVHPLHDATHDHALARLFGEHTARDTDKFAQCGWTEGPSGVPILVGLDWFAGPVVERFDVGDHVAHVVDVTAGSAPRAHEPWLMLRDVLDLDPGNPP